MDDPRAALSVCIERDTKELERALADLESELGRTFDVGRRISERSYPWILAAFGAGLWLALRHDASPHQ